MNLSRKQLCLALASSALLGLSACGDGDSGSVASSTSFSGTAATGAAMAGATVSISCAAGSGTATTSSSGGYSTSISGATLPCAIKATSSNGSTVLYSVVAPGSSSTQVANITPLTQLLVASLAGTDPASFFSNFSSNASTVTSSSISTAQTAVLTTLSNAGLNVSSLPDLLTGSLVAATSSSSGNAYDQALDALQTQLTASGTSLATLTNTMATTSTASTSSDSSSNSHTPSLPASLLLKTAASSCSALRSGDYRVFQPQQNQALSNQYGSSSLNASTLVWSDTGGGGSTWTAGSDACSFSDSNGSYVVSQAGVILGYNTDQTVAGLTFAIPKQSLTLADVAGTWNMLNFEDAGSSYAAHVATLTLDSTGAVSNFNYCDGTTSSATCGLSTPAHTLSTDGDGGFIFTTAGNSEPDHIYGYRSGSGDLVLISIHADGTFAAFTKKRSLSLPAVDSVGAKSWYVQANSALLANTLSSNAADKVTAVDTATSSVTRTQYASTGAADYTITNVYNQPRDGFHYRAAASVTSTYDSRTVTIRERTSLPLRGMGVSFQSFPSQTALRIVVDQP